jgi:2'-5' RNA ligase
MNMYFTAIVLPDELNEQILQYKNFMLEKYACRVGLNSPAHITILSPFWMNELVEPELLNGADQLGGQTTPFTIHTTNFSVFEPKTIFIEVQNNQNLSQLKTASDNYFKSHSVFKAKIDNRTFHPHITIATRDLHKKSFYEAWDIFKHKNFKEEWTAKGLSILKHNKKNWDVIYTSQFQKKE